MSSTLKHIILLTSLLLQISAAQDVNLLKRIKECLSEDGPSICLKERALDVLNETIRSEKPISIYGIIDITKNKDYLWNHTEDEALPRDFKEKSEKLNEMLFDKVEEFLESRSVKINLGSVFEGRGRKNKNKGGMLMMGGLAMAGMMAQLFMGKIAFMAGAALLVAKLALLLSTVIGFKKLSGGGSGGYDRASLLILGGLAMTGLMMKLFMGKVGITGTATLLAVKKIVLLLIYAVIKFKKFKQMEMMMFSDTEDEEIECDDECDDVDYDYEHEDVDDERERMFLNYFLKN